MRRQRSEWMRPIDDLILEFLHDGCNFRPVDIAEEIGRDRQYVGTRCRLLTEYGLLYQAGATPGLYTITDTGLGYLEGTVDTAQLDKD